MKIRNGFISNSSTSSFVCGVCGHIEAERDCGLKDFEMKECEHGHVFHIDCNTVKMPPLTNERIYTELKETYSKELSFLHDNVQLYEDVLAGKREPKYDWEKSYSKSYFEREIERYKEAIKDFENKLEKLNDYYENKQESFGGYYEPIYEEEFYDAPVKEEFCPVCNKLKQMKQDPRYNEYKELFEHFGVLPDGTHA